MTNKLTDEELFTLNPFKDRISNTNYRACVGKNSGLSHNSRDCAIIDGYKENVDLLYKNMEKKNIWIDIGVYPFIFCCRHSIELSLKTILKNLMIIYKQKNNITTRNDYLCKVENVCKQHDIKSLYNELILFKEFQNEIKEELSKFNRLEQCIKDYYFDIDGDSFRYTFKRNLEKTNLEDVQIIDIGLLYWKYNKLMKFFDYLINSFSKQLLIDYTKTYTQHLSRSRLEKLSFDVKDISVWTKKEIIQNKKELCLKYQISSSEFDKALDKIKNNYSFCTNLGIEKKFKNLTEDFFVKLGDVYKWYIKKESSKLPTEEMGLDIFESDKYSPLSEAYFNYCLEKADSLSDEEKRIMLTFYEVTSTPIDGGYLCEDIDWLYNSWEEMLSDDCYIAEKIDCMICDKRLRKALEMCGQITYLQWFDKYVV